MLCPDRKNPAKEVIVIDGLVRAHRGFRRAARVGEPQEDRSDGARLAPERAAGVGRFVAARVPRSGMGSLSSNGALTASAPGLGVCHVTFLPSGRELKRRDCHLEAETHGAP